MAGIISLGEDTRGRWENLHPCTVDALTLIGVNASLVKEDYITNTLSRDNADVVWFPGGGAHAVYRVQTTSRGRPAKSVSGGNLERA